ncbi:MAG: DUF2256 domain-containing protein [Rhabdochlamydiaceae bacterium]
MPKGVEKKHLPEKVCVVCDRPFKWRKKWEKVWEDVKYCSSQCQKKKKYEEISHQGLQM